MCLPHCLMYPFPSQIIQRTIIAGFSSHLSHPKCRKFIDLIYLFKIFLPPIFQQLFSFAIYFLYIIQHVFVLINYLSLILYIYRGQGKKQNYFYFYYFINFLVHNCTREYEVTAKVITFENSMNVNVQHINCSLRQCFFLSYSYHYYIFKNHRNGEGH